MAPVSLAVVARLRRRRRRQSPPFLGVLCFSISSRRSLWQSEASLATLRRQTGQTLRRLPMFSMRCSNAPNPFHLHNANDLNGRLGADARFAGAGSRDDLRLSVAARVDSLDRAVAR
jgi:hypothetical protein